MWERGVQTVGVIGLGSIGRGVVESLCRVGFEVTVTDLRRDAMTRFAEQASEVDRPSSMARCDVVVVAVMTDEQVIEVIAGPDGLLAGDGSCRAVVVVSTIAISTVRRVFALLQASGIDLVDCGVSGGGPAAAAGSIVAMVGGDEDAVSYVRPVIDAFASPVVHMGPSGAGLSAKLARNVIHYGSRLATYEGRLLAKRAGIDDERLRQVVASSDKRIGGNQAFFERDAPPALGTDADSDVVGSRRAREAMARKDLRGALELAAELGVELPLASMLGDRYHAVLGLPDGESTGSLDEQTNGR